MQKQFITVVNGIEIATVRDEEHNFFVPVKPICEAIGVDPEAQRQRIMRHYILGSTAFTLKVVAADDKEREMLCLPLEYVYGWLFTIDANLVAEANRENVKRYQLECYQALYNYFDGSLRRRVEENEAEIKALQAVNEAIKEVKAAKAAQKEAEEHLDAIRKARLDTAPTLF
ncbi:MAG: phage antirepressor N-terminal domain-containing protein [Lepagella sp.]